jgi:hypothetical protein
VLGQKVSSPLPPSRQASATASARSVGVRTNQTQRREREKGKRTDRPRRSQQVSAGWLLLELEPIFNGATRLEVQEMFRRTAVRCIGRLLSTQYRWRWDAKLQHKSAIQCSDGETKWQCSSAHILTTRFLALPSDADSCLPIAASARQEGCLSSSYLLTGISVRVSCGTVVSFALTAPKPSGSLPALVARQISLSPTHRKSERASAHRIPFREPMPLNWNVTASKVHWLASTILRRLRIANVRCVLDF